MASKFKEIIYKFKELAKSKGYEELEPVGLISPAFPNEFNVSAGHNYTTHFIKNKISKKYFLVETCFRRIDADKIGFSPIHLTTFFNMEVGISFPKADKDKAIKMLIRDSFDILSKFVKLKPLKITYFKGGKISNVFFPPEPLIKEGLIRIGFLSKNIISTHSRVSFFGTQSVDFAGPTCEIFSPHPQRWIEIGSLNFYKFDRTDNFKELDPQILVCSLGVERLMMVMEKAKTIMDTSLLSGIKHFIVQEIGEELAEIFPNSVNILTDHIRSAFFIVSSGISPKEMNPRSKILRTLLKRILKQFEYLGISFKEIEKILDNIEDFSFTKEYNSFCPWMKVKQNISKIIFGYLKNIEGD